MLPKPNKPSCDIKSYRPISLTSCTSKLLEKMILNRITSHLEIHSIIPPNQSGFRKGFSTQNHMFNLTNNAINNFNKGNYTGVVMFDIEKAFDRVWHEGLIFKLHKIQLPVYLINWIKSFLKQRQFEVKYKDKISERKNIPAGVPQGCIISPTLFSIYIHDLNHVLTEENGQYADDISVWTSNKSLKKIEKTLQKEIDKISNFCEEWCIALCGDKTTYITLTNACKRKQYEGKYKLQLHVKGNPIRLDPNPRLLGIFLDPKLSFHTHLDRINEKIQKRINVIKILKSKRWSSSRDLLIYFYKSCIRLIIEFGSVVFSCANDDLKRKIQVLENKIIRLCLNSHYLESTDEIHETAKIVKIEQRLKQLHTNFLRRSYLQRRNMLLCQMLVEEVEDTQLTNTATKLKKARINCLSNFKIELNSIIKP